MVAAVQVYIGLGSNLDNPVDQLRQAITSIHELPDCRLLAVSPLYRSKPMGPQDQPDYVNGVVELETSLQPEALLDHLQSIENQQGRVRQQRWGARTLDLDILLYGEMVIQSPRLTVPHSGMHLRSFVLYPLADISPSLHIPGRGTLSQLLSTVSDEELQCLGELSGLSKGVV